MRLAGSVFLACLGLLIAVASSYLTSLPSEWMGAPRWVLLSLFGVLLAYSGYVLVANRSSPLPPLPSRDSEVASGLQTEATKPINAAVMAEVKKMYPALYICHGGGPLPVLDDPMHRPMVAALKKNVRDIVSRYGPPKAVAVVSAHYNTAQPEIGGNPKPEMYYDYGGFPKESYHLQYPAPGNSSIAKDMVDEMKAMGLKAKLNPTRPYDHGVFVPLMLMFPNADVPVIPISVLISDDPSEHMAMGKALRRFREDGVFFVGSGASMHHFGNFMKVGAGTRFGDALTDVLKDSADMTPEKRIEAMRHVEQFDGFSEAQPSGAHEHLMPLFTLLGTADGKPAKEVASVPFMAANVRHYMFEE